MMTSNDLIPLNDCMPQPQQRRQPVPVPQASVQTVVLSGRRLALMWLFSLGSYLCMGCETSVPEPQIRDNTSWAEIEHLARGKTIRMAMWDGDPLINRYMREFVIPELSKRHQIQLELTGLHGSALVNKLTVDLETSRAVGDLDLVWINGENFYQLRRLNALYGPFTERLPNNDLIDWTDPFIATDFQQPVEGYECPWGNVQLALIYNSARVDLPPQSLTDLRQWIHENPGRFTFDNGFTGMTFLKSLLIEFGGGPESFVGPFNEAQYQRASAELWKWLRDIQPMLWREGRTFPESVSQLHQLMNNGEVDFSMSNNDGEVDNKVEQGILPPESRAYVPAFGTIRNSHYLGIPANAQSKAAAMVVCNFLISPEAQHRKAIPAVWGDGTILATDKLPEEWKDAFRTIEGRTRIAPRDELQRHALMEPAPEIMIRIHEDFRREIIERKK